MYIRTQRALTVRVSEDCVNIFKTTDALDKLCDVLYDYGELAQLDKNDINEYHLLNFRYDLPEKEIEEYER